MTGQDSPRKSPTTKLETYFHSVLEHHANTTCNTDLMILLIIHSVFSSAFLSKAERLAREKRDVALSIIITQIHQTIRFPGESASPDSEEVQIKRLASDRANKKRIRENFVIIKKLLSVSIANARQDRPAVVVSTCKGSRSKKENEGLDQQNDTSDKQTDILNQRNKALAQQNRTSDEKNEVSDHQSKTLNQQDEDLNQNRDVSEQSNEASIQQNNTLTQQNKNFNQQSRASDRNNEDSNHQSKGLNQEDKALKQNRDTSDQSNEASIRQNKGFTEQNKDLNQENRASDQKNEVSYQQSKGLTPQDEALKQNREASDQSNKTLTQQNTSLAQQNKDLNQSSEDLEQQDTVSMDQVNRLAFSPPQCDQDVSEASIGELLGKAGFCPRRPGTPTPPRRSWRTERGRASLRTAKARARRRIATSSKTGSLDREVGVHLCKKITGEDSFIDTSSVSSTEDVEVETAEDNVRINKNTRTSETAFLDTFNISSDEETKFEIREETGFQIPQETGFQIPEDTKFEIIKNTEFEVSQDSQFVIPQGADFQIPESTEFEITKSTEFQAPKDNIQLDERTRWSGTAFLTTFISSKEDTRNVLKVLDHLNNRHKHQSEENSENRQSDIISYLAGIKLLASQLTDAELQQTCIDLQKQQNDLNSQHTDLNSQHTDLNSQHIDINCQHTDINSQHTDLFPQRTDLNSQHIDINSQHTDINSQHTDRNLQLADGKPQAKQQEAISSQSDKKVQEEQSTVIELQDQQQTNLNSQQTTSTTIPQTEDDATKKEKRETMFEALLACVEIMAHQEQQTDMTEQQKERTPQETAVQEMTLQDTASQEITSHGTSPERLSQEMTLQETASQETASHEITSQEVTLQESTPQEIISQDIMPQEKLSQYIIPQEILSQDIISQDIMSQDRTPQIIILEDVTPQEITLQEITLQDITPQEIIPQEIATQETTQEKTLQEFIPQEKTPQLTTAAETAPQDDCPTTCEQPSGVRFLTSWDFIETTSPCDQQESHTRGRASSEQSKPDNQGSVDTGLLETLLHEALQRETGKSHEPASEETSTAHRISKNGDRNQSDPTAQTTESPPDLLNSLLDDLSNKNQAQCLVLLETSALNVKAHAVATVNNVLACHCTEESPSNFVCKPEDYVHTMEMYARATHDQRLVAMMVALGEELKIGKAAWKACYSYANKTDNSRLLECLEDMVQKTTFCSLALMKHISSVLKDRKMQELVMDYYEQLMELKGVEDNDKFTDVSMLGVNMHQSETTEDESCSRKEGGGQERTSSQRSGHSLRDLTLRGDKSLAGRLMHYKLWRLAEKQGIRELQSLLRDFPPTNLHFTDTVYLWAEGDAALTECISSVEKESLYIQDAWESVCDHLDSHSQTDACQDRGRGQDKGGCQGMKCKDTILCQDLKERCQEMKGDDFSWSTLKTFALDLNSSSVSILLERYENSLTRAVEESSSGRSVIINLIEGPKSPPSPASHQTVQLGKIADFDKAPLFDVGRLFTKLKDHAERTANTELAILLLQFDHLPDLVLWEPFNAVAMSFRDFASKEQDVMLIRLYNGTMLNIVTDMFRKQITTHAHKHKNAPLLRAISRLPKYSDFVTLKKLENIANKHRDEYLRELLTSVQVLGVRFHVNVKKVENDAGTGVFDDPDVLLKQGNRTSDVEQANETLNNLHEQPSTETETPNTTTTTTTNTNTTNTTTDPPLFHLRHTAMYSLLQQLSKHPRFSSLADILLHHATLSDDYLRNICTLAISDPVFHAAHQRLWKQSVYLDHTWTELILSAKANQVPDLQSILAEEAEGRFSFKRVKKFAEERGYKDLKQRIETCEEEFKQYDIDDLIEEGVENKEIRQKTDECRIEGIPSPSKRQTPQKLVDESGYGSLKRTTEKCEELKQNAIEDMEECVGENEENRHVTDDSEMPFTSLPSPPPSPPPKHATLQESADASGNDTLNPTTENTEEKVRLPDTEDLEERRQRASECLKKRSNGGQMELLQKDNGKGVTSGPASDCDRLLISDKTTEIGLYSTDFQLLMKTLHDQLEDYARRTHNRRLTLYVDLLTSPVSSLTLNVITDHIYTYCMAYTDNLLNLLLSRTTTEIQATRLAWQSLLDYADKRNDPELRRVCSELDLPHRYHGMGRMRQIAEQLQDAGLNVLIEFQEKLQQVRDQTMEVGCQQQEENAVDEDDTDGEAPSRKISTGWGDKIYLQRIHKFLKDITDEDDDEILAVLTKYDSRDRQFLYHLAPLAQLRPYLLHFMQQEDVLIHSILDTLSSHAHATDNTALATAVQQELDLKTFSLDSLHCLARDSGDQDLEQVISREEGRVDKLMVHARLMKMYGDLPPLESYEKEGEEEKEEHEDKKVEGKEDDDDDDDDDDDEEEEEEEEEEMEEVKEKAPEEEEKERNEEEDEKMENEEYAEADKENNKDAVHHGPKPTRAAENPDPRDKPTADAASNSSSDVSLTDEDDVEEDPKELRDALRRHALTNRDFILKQLLCNLERQKLCIVPRVRRLAKDTHNKALTLVLDNLTKRFPYCQKDRNEPKTIMTFKLSKSDTPFQRKYKLEQSLVNMYVLNRPDDPLLSLPPPANVAEIKQDFSVPPPVIILKK